MTSTSGSEAQGGRDCNTEELLITNLLVGVLRLGEAGGGLHDEDGDEDEDHEAGGGHGHGYGAEHTGTWRLDTESCYLLHYSGDITDISCILLQYLEHRYLV